MKGSAGFRPRAGEMCEMTLGSLLDNDEEEGGLKSGQKSGSLWDGSQHL